jgi:hypothetical protein
MHPQLTRNSRDDFKLVFAAERGSSLPKLMAVGEVDVSHADLLVWEDELNEAYERIYAGSRRQLFHFQTRIGQLPTSYEVEVKPTPAHGVHTLELTPIVDGCVRAANLPVEKPTGEKPPFENPPAISEPPSAPATAEWRAKEFVQALDLLFQQLPLESPGRASIERVLAELDGLAEHSPIELLLILFSGYLHCGQNRKTGTERDLAFVNSSYAVDQICRVLVLDVPTAVRTGAIPTLYDRYVRQLVGRLRGGL